MSIEYTVSRNLLITVNDLINAVVSIPREFKNSGISTPSVDMSRSSRDPCCSFKSRPTTMSDSSLRVIVSPSLVYCYFEKPCKPWLINQETGWIELKKHTFLHISLPSLHDYNVNCLISQFMEDLNTSHLFSVSFCELRYSPIEFNSWKSRQHLTN